jgi:hypothetical protein
MYSSTSHQQTLKCNTHLQIRTARIATGGVCRTMKQHHDHNAHAFAHTLQVATWDLHVPLIYIVFQTLLRAGYVFYALL